MSTETAQITKKTGQILKKKLPKRDIENLRRLNIQGNIGWTKETLEKKGISWDLPEDIMMNSVKQAIEKYKKSR